MGPSRTPILGATEPCGGWKEKNPIPVLPGWSWLQISPKVSWSSKQSKGLSRYPMTGTMTMGIGCYFFCFWCSLEGHPFSACCSYFRGGCAVGSVLYQWDYTGTSRAGGHQTRVGWPSFTSALGLYVVT